MLLRLCQVGNLTQLEKPIWSQIKSSLKTIEKFRLRSTLSLLMVSKRPHRWVMLIEPKKRSLKCQLKYQVAGLIQMMSSLSNNARIWTLQQQLSLPRIRIQMKSKETRSRHPKLSNSSYSNSNSSNSNSSNSNSRKLYKPNNSNQSKTNMHNNRQATLHLNNNTHLNSPKSRWPCLSTLELRASDLANSTLCWATSQLSSRIFLCPILNILLGRNWLTRKLRRLRPTDNTDLDSKTWSKIWLLNSQLRTL